MSSSLLINVDDLLRFRGVDSACVEFKADWNDGPTAIQVLHTVCAFANDIYNLNGGYVILGVEAESGVAELPPRGIDHRSYMTVVLPAHSNGSHPVIALQ